MNSMSTQAMAWIAMPVEACVHEALRRTPRGRFVSERDFRFDDRVQPGVHLCVRHANTRSPVIVPRKFNALLLIEREPFFRVGRYYGMLRLHATQSRNYVASKTPRLQVPTGIDAKLLGLLLLLSQKLF
jgi:hypothetical protein